MADNTSANRGYLHTGAERFHTLLQALRTETEHQLDERMTDVEVGIDVRDYRQLAQMIEEHLPPHGDALREGFMRSLADLLSVVADGCCIDIEEPMRLEPIGGGCAATSDHRPTGESSGAARPGSSLSHKALSSFDLWSGSAADLCAAGVASIDEFPGQPGRPLTRVSFRPAGGKQGELWWHLAQGYRTIHRAGAGFQVRITPSRAERERRKLLEAERIERESSARAERRAEARASNVRSIPARTDRPPPLRVVWSAPAVPARL